MCTETHPECRQLRSRIRISTHLSVFPHCGCNATIYFLFLPPWISHHTPKTMSPNKPFLSYFCDVCHSNEKSNLNTESVSFSLKIKAVLVSSWSLCNNLDFWLWHVKLYLLLLVFYLSSSKLLTILGNVSLSALYFLHTQLFHNSFLA